MLFKDLTFLTSKLQSIGLEPMTSPSTLRLQGDDVPFELDLIGKDLIFNQWELPAWQHIQIVMNLS